jgi:hypothetical protein
MGCDIHAVIEIKHGAVFWWWAAEVHIDRDYQLFTLLAGVRCPDRVIKYIEPRGWPDPCSYRVTHLAEEWEDDGHSASWLTVEECEAVIARWKDAFPDSEPNYDFAAWVGAMRALKLPGNEVRIVFCFDN